MAAVPATFGCVGQALKTVASNFLYLSRTLLVPHPFMIPYAVFHFCVFPSALAGIKPNVNCVILYLKDK